MHVGTCEHAEMTLVQPFGLSKESLRVAERSLTGGSGGLPADNLGAGMSLGVLCVPWTVSRRSAPTSRSPLRFAVGVGGCVVRRPIVVVLTGVGRRWMMTIGARVFFPAWFAWCATSYGTALRSRRVLSSHNQRTRQSCRFMRVVAHVCNSVYCAIIGFVTMFQACEENTHSALSCMSGEQRLW